MPQAIRYTLLSIRDLAISAGPFALAAVALLVLACLWLDPTPPKRVTLAIIAVLLPLSRIVPPLYQFRIRSRVFRWYGQLREIEERLLAEPGRRAELLRELDLLDEKAGRISVPLSYADELYALRNNIQAVRQRGSAGA
jgi:hypothetical protein